MREKSIRQNASIGTQKNETEKGIRETDGELTNITTENHQCVLHNQTSKQTNQR